MIGLLLSSKINDIAPSGTLQMLDNAKRLEREGFEVTHLEVGDPDLKTPEEIINVAIEAMRQGFTHYTSSRGIYELREAIVEKKGGNLKSFLDPNKHVIVTPGAKFALFAALSAVINPGDKVLILTPSWVSYKAMIIANFGVPYEFDIDNHSFDDLEEFVKEIKPRAIIFNSPNNPTGRILTYQEINRLVDMALTEDIFLISDEIYDGIVFSDNFVSLSSFKDAFDYSVIINGFSKTYAMTGWRIGYAISNEEIINAMVKVQQYTSTCPVSFVQKAAAFALSDKRVGQKVEKMRLLYKERRDIFVKLLKEVPHIDFKFPEGTFYIFPNISYFINDDSNFALRFLKTKHVCVTPGNIFGTGGRGHIRFSLTVNKEKLVDSFNKFLQFITEDI